MRINKYQVRRRTEAANTAEDEVVKPDTEFVCEICDKVYVRQAYFEKHMDEIHPGPDPDNDNSQEEDDDVN